MNSTHQPADALIETLHREHVRYELIPHRHTESAVAEAKAVGVDTHEVAKTLILQTPFGYVRTVISAADRLDLAKARFALDCAEVELADETSLIGAYPEFELGAVPPLGGPYDRVLVDARLFDCETIVLEAGTHNESVRLRPSELLSVSDAEVADLVIDDRSAAERTR